MKRGVIILLTALAILLPTISANALSNSGGGSWWYYREITISNTGSALTDYQVLMNLTGSSFPINAQASGADIRFTNVSGAELSYWIESWDYAGRNAKIWVNVTSIPAGATSMRMYYGNPSAISASNGTNTFEFFDDFNDNSLDSNKWAILLPKASDSVTETNQELVVHTATQQSGVSASAVTKSKFSISSGRAFLTKFKTTSCINCIGTIFTITPDNTTPNHDNIQNLIEIYTYSDDGKIYGGLRDGGTSEFNAQIATVDFTAYHNYVLKVDSTHVKFYIDDVEKWNTTHNQSWISTASYYRGDAWYNSHDNFYDDFFVRKFSSPKPFATIGAEETYGLVGYWRFDEGTGNATADSSGNGNNGTLYNFNWDANSNWVEGKFGKALRFDGSNDYVSIPDAPSFTISEVTLEAWIKPDNTIFQGIVTNHANGVNADGSWVLYKSDKACFIIFTNTGEQLPACGGSISTGSWQHIAAIWNNSSGSKIYLNGVNVGNASTSGTLPDPANPIEIGRYHVYNPPNQYWFSGIIDEVRIYNRTLSAEEIKAHYEQGAGAPIGNSIGYSAIVATGQITSVVATNGSFGLIPKSQTKTINNSVTLNNTGDLSARVEARFNDSIAGVFGLISGANNILNASNFALGIPSALMPLNNSGANIQVAVAPPGVTALDAKLGVPGEQVAGDYSGTVILTFSNNV